MMVFPFLTAVGFGLCAIAIAVLLGSIMGLGLGMRHFGLDRVPKLRFVSTVVDIMLTAIEFLPSIAVLLVGAWVFVNEMSMTAKFFEFVLIGGVVWSAPVARFVGSLIEREFRENYPRQLVVFGIRPVRHLVMQTFLPSNLREGVVVILNLFIYALVVDTSVGYLMRYSTRLHEARIQYYAGSYGESLASMVSTPLAFYPSLLWFIAVVGGLSLLSQKLGAAVGQTMGRMRFSQIRDEPGLVLRGKNLRIDLGTRSRYHMEAPGFTFSAQDVVWLSGSSGSGKSLFFKCILGLAPEGSTIGGALEGVGKNILEQTDLIFQEPSVYLFPYLPVRRVLVEAGVSIEQVDLPEKARPILEQFIRHCSAGERRLIFLSLFLYRIRRSAEKRLLLCDEPDASLDEANRESMLANIRRLRQQRPTLAVVYITHDKEVGAALGDFAGESFRRLYAEQGRISATPTQPPPFEPLPLGSRPAPDATRSTDPTGATAPLLEVSDLTVCVEDRAIVANRSFRLEVGQRIAIVGRNGSGKSTLLRGIMNIMPRERISRVVVGGNRRSNSWDYRKLGEHISYLFEDSEHSFPPDIHLGRVIAWFCERHRLDASQIYRRLESVGLSTDVRTRYPMELSGGQRQLLCFVLATEVETKRIVLMDEPFSRLDDHSRLRLIHLVQADRERGYVIITHNREDIDALGCQIVYVSEEEERHYLKRWQPSRH